MLARFAFVLALLLVTGSAFAQSSEVIPPRLTTDAGAEYPRRALDEHIARTVTVTLLVDVAADGKVAGATVTEPQGHGFDEAAIAAAQKLVFEPATRDGHPIAARIRFRYELRPPPTRLVGRVTTEVTDRPIAGAIVVVRDANGEEHRATTGADGAWSFADLPPGAVHVDVTAEGRVANTVDETLAPAEETSVLLRLSSIPEASSVPSSTPEPDVTEVNVRGTKPPREVTKRTLNRDEIDHIPGTNGDALRSLQNLPGVARPPPFNGALIVRGSAPSDTNIFVDGTAVPLIYHFGGLSSVVPTELLDRIDFYPGNYGATYGRGTGGVVDVALRKPRTDGYHGFAQVDFIDARLLVEGPIRAGWSFLVAGRRSWFDLWLGKALEKADFGATAAPRYYDWQAMVSKDLGKDSSFRLLLFGSDDALEIVNQAPNASNPTLGGDIGFHTSFWRLQARYENKLTDNTDVHVTAAYGRVTVDAGVGTNAIRSTLQPISGRAELTQKVVRGLTANVGLDVLFEPYELFFQLPPPRAAGVPAGGPGAIPVRSDSDGSFFQPAGYVELEIVPRAGTRLVPSVRADYDSGGRDWNVAPRLTVRQDIVSDFPKTTAKGGAGVFYQPPSALDIAPRYGQTGLESSRAFQYDVGVEQDFTRAINLSIDGFYKDFDRQIVVGNGNRGTGLAYGAEWLLRYKPTDRFFGWVSYTLSRSERRDGEGRPLTLFQYDQTHILTVLGSVKLGRGWQVGARFRLTSGDLYTPEVTGAYDGAIGSQLSSSAYPPYGARFPLFEQLDLRADKQWTFEHWKLTAYLDVQNVYNAKNPIGVAYNYNFTQTGRITGLPVLPSFGVRGEL